MTMSSRARIFEKKKKTYLQKAFDADTHALQHHPLYGCFDWEKAAVYEEITESCGGDMLVSELMGNKAAYVDGNRKGISAVAEEDAPLWVAKVKEYTAFTAGLEGNSAEQDKEAECEVTKDLTIKYPVRFLLQREKQACRLNVPEIANATKVCRLDLGVPDDLLNAVQCRWDPLSLEVTPISTADAVSQLLSADHKPLARSTVHHDLIQLDEVDFAAELHPRLHTVRANLTALVRITVWSGRCGLLAARSDKDEVSKSKAKGKEDKDKDKASSTTSAALRAAYGDELGQDSSAALRAAYGDELGQDVKYELEELFLGESALEDLTEDGLKPSRAGQNLYVRKIVSLDGTHGSDTLSPLAHDVLQSGLLNQEVAQGKARADAEVLEAPWAMGLAPSAEEVTIEDGESRVEVFQSSAHRAEVWRTHFDEGVSHRWDTEEVGAVTSLDLDGSDGAVSGGNVRTSANRAAKLGSGDAADGSQCRLTGFSEKCMDEAEAEDQDTEADESQTQKFSALLAVVVTFIVLIARGYVHALSRAAVSRASAMVMERRADRRMRRTEEDRERFDAIKRKLDAQQMTNSNSKSNRDTINSNANNALSAPLTKMPTNKESADARGERDSGDSELMSRHTRNSNSFEKDLITGVPDVVGGDDEDGLEDDDIAQAEVEGGKKKKSKKNKDKKSKKDNKKFNGVTVEKPLASGSPQE